MQALSLALPESARVRALIAGEVGAPELSLRTFTGSPAGILEQMSGAAEFDVGEYSLSDYLRAFAAGAAEYVALPVFPHRAFRHSMLWVSTSSHFAALADLRGMRVGIGAYATTGLMFLRGVLREEHGVAPADITWVRTEPERLPIKVPGVWIAESPATLEDLLASGGVDAIAAFRPPPSASEDPPRARTLIPNVEAVEADYYRRTGIFPIMHVVVLRRSIDESDRTIAPRLVTAFEESRRLAESRGEPSQPSWEYGIEANRKTLEAAVRYARSQYGIELPDDVAELFAPSVRG